MFSNVTRYSVPQQACSTNGRQKQTILLVQLLFQGQNGQTTQKRVYPGRITIFPLIKREYFDYRLYIVFATALRWFGGGHMEIRYRRGMRSTCLVTCLISL